MLLVASSLHLDGGVERVQLPFCLLFGVGFSSCAASPCHQRELQTHTVCCVTHSASLIVGTGPDH